MSSSRIFGVIVHDENAARMHTLIMYVYAHTHTHTNKHAKKKHLVRKNGVKRKIFKPKLRWKHTVTTDRLKWWEDVKILRNYPLAYIIGESFLSSWITTSFLRKTG